MEFIFLEKVMMGSIVFWKKAWMGIMFLEKGMDGHHGSLFFVRERHGWASLFFFWRKAWMECIVFLEQGMDGHHVFLQKGIEWASLFCFGERHGWN